ncbi:MAG TPA: cytochrome c peroxidase, partial [Polyangiaceae bacterium]|nr:cytochrome c peroxidase [Polyangiaceae bacterium]
MRFVTNKNLSTFAFTVAALTAFSCADDTGAQSGTGADEARAPGGTSGPSGSGTGFNEFTTPIPNGNGRSCATCHDPTKNFTITPAQAEARFQANPNDPLFRSIDADDFASNFTTVRTKALFRVTIPLPANVKLVDDPAATEVKLFRAVPSIFNVKLTAPYTSDGRAPTLFEQAKGAALEHSRPA